MTYSLTDAERDIAFIRRCREIDRMAGIVWADEGDGRSAALPGRACFTSRAKPAAAIARKDER